MNNDVASPRKKSRKFILSVVTTVYQDLEGLKLTAKSVLSQTVPVEWIIVDADSGRETIDYLRQIPSGIHEVRWISEKDYGLYDGMNKGFSRTRGKIVLFLNAQDTFENSEVAARICDSYCEEQWLWAVALAVRINSNFVPHGVWEYLNPSLGGLALGTRTFCHQSTFYDRDFLETLLPYDISNLASDHLVNVRAFKRKDPKMLPFVATLFMDGGVSSKRPLGAAFRDLRKIRKEEKLLLLNSSVLDYILTKLVILLVKFGSVTWSGLRFIAHRLLIPKKRVHPE